MTKLNRIIAAFVIFMVCASVDANAQRRAKGYSQVGSLGYHTHIELPPELSLDVFFKEPSGNDVLDAGEVGQLIVAIKNSGKGDANKAYVAITPLVETPHIRFSEKTEIPPVAAGESVRGAIHLQSDEEMPTQLLRFRLKVVELEYRADSDPVDIELPAEALKPPRLELAEFGIDDGREGQAQGNNNGKIELGEAIEVTAVIQNRGTGTAEQVVVRLDDLPPGIMHLDQKKSRILLNDTLLPEEWRTVKFAFYVNKQFTGAEIPFSLMLEEKRPRFSRLVSETLAVNQSLKRGTQIVIRGRKRTPLDSRNTSLPELNVDIEQDIPKMRLSNPDAVAVVIGISRYANELPEVNFAVRDATLMQDYLIKQFGYDQANIFFLDNENATKGALESALDPGGQLANLVKPGRSEVFVYYSGHGAPELEDRQQYLVPYDCHPDFLQHSGYALSRLYENLAGLDAKSVTVVLEACFSGGTAQGKMLISQISPIFIQTRNPLINIPNSAVFTAASKNEVAVWHEAKSHGLFTYFFLKGLKGAADHNDNHVITVAEMKQYLLEWVPYHARRLRNKKQTPNVSAANPDLELARY